jgi:hypothetical protein
MAFLIKVCLGGCVLCGVVLTPALAELRTTGTGIACLEASKLAAAEAALQKRDRARMDMLGCFPVATGTLASRIDNDAGSL